eukprot:jgi/Mesvir1/18081/Mv09383-RA.4
MEDWGSRVAAAVHAKYASLKKTGKPQSHEYALLAGFAISEGPWGGAEGGAQGSLRVVACGTGTKCLSASRLSSAGDLVSDTHAEVVARRALLRFLYSEIHRALLLANVPPPSDPTHQAPSRPVIPDSHVLPSSSKQASSKSGFSSSKQGGGGCTGAADTERAADQKPTVGKQGQHAPIFEIVPLGADGHGLKGHGQEDRAIQDGWGLEVGQSNGCEGGRCGSPMDCADPGVLNVPGGSAREEETAGSASDHERDADGGRQRYGARLRRGVCFHMYLSQLPCGDGSIFSLASTPEMPASTDAGEVPLPAPTLAPSTPGMCPDPWSAAPARCDANVRDKDSRLARLAADSDNALSSNDPTGPCSPSTRASTINPSTESLAALAHCKHARNEPEESPSPCESRAEPSHRDGTRESAGGCLAPLPKRLRKRNAAAANAPLDADGSRHSDVAGASDDVDGTGGSGTTQPGHGNRQAAPGHGSTGAKLVPLLPRFVPTGDRINDMAHPVTEVAPEQGRDEASQFPRQVSSGIVDHVRGMGDGVRMGNGDSSRGRNSGGSDAVQAGRPLRAPAVGTEQAAAPAATMLGTGASIISALRAGLVAPEEVKRLQMRTAGGAARELGSMRMREGATNQPGAAMEGNIVQPGGSEVETGRWEAANRATTAQLYDAGGNEGDCGDMDGMASTTMCAAGARQGAEMGLGAGVGVSSTLPGGGMPSGQLRGQVRRKPGRGEPCLSMSCSDKMARWNCLGLQGALLSQLLYPASVPIYLSSVTVAATGICASASSADVTNAKEALERALFGRLACMAPSFQEPFRVCQPSVFIAQNVPGSGDFSLAAGSSRVPCGYVRVQEGEPCVTASIELSERKP